MKYLVWGKRDFYSQKKKQNYYMVQILPIENGLIKSKFISDKFVDEKVYEKIEPDTIVNVEFDYRGNINDISLVSKIQIEFKSINQSENSKDDVAVSWD